MEVHDGVHGDDGGLYCFDRLDDNGGGHGGHAHADGDGVHQGGHSGGGGGVHVHSGGGGDAQHDCQRVLFSLSFSKLYPWTLV